MPSTRRHSCDLNFVLKIVAEMEAAMTIFFNGLFSSLPHFMGMSWEFVQFFLMSVISSIHFLARSLFAEITSALFINLFAITASQNT